MTLTVQAAAPHHSAGLVALFQRTESPCFCRWWHFEGDKNAWLDRCANRPDQSRAELERALALGNGEAQGIVALDETGTLIGWMKLTPASGVPKLFEQRLYKGLPCLNGPRDAVWVIGCFLIDEAWRRKGVAGALLDAGIALARRGGASSLEAFPRRADDVPAEAQWTGPYALYRARGFEVVHEETPYPVLRLPLGSAP